jgi:hypothetical protein
LGKDTTMSMILKEQEGMQDKYRGSHLIREPLVNKGGAFSDAERGKLGLARAAAAHAC